MKNIIEKINEGRNREYQFLLSKDENTQKKLQSAGVPQKIIDMLLSIDYEGRMSACLSTGDFGAILAEIYKDLKES